MTPIQPLSRDQVRRVDQLAVERYHMPSIVLMENAGRGAAEIIYKSFGQAGKATIFCGTGNNGGDGFVIARHLHNFGWAVRLIVTGEAAGMTPDTRTNYAIVEAMGLPCTFALDRASQPTAVSEIQCDEVVIDALLGTGFRGTVREPLRSLIDDIHSRPKRAVVAIDVPSGLDCDTGAVGGAAIRADLTVTFAAPKIGFSQCAAHVCVGRIEVVDIGVPRESIDEIAASR
ncbi:MAG: NAD(P)H-hydrate epimerase [Planctomycetes bacterium]|nr:NAD(P)H-hydrate epimerase [Planctomycetota bacterium]